ncbi:TNR6 factor, partial [Chordeiles acutipennis]|nr:TNR6 factor [Chordeiles acutipennis]
GFVKNTTCPTNISKDCVPCKNGKEYIDHANDLDECLRCSSCDSVFGLEVAKNCTPVQNTECTCAENHFCNSSVPCRHCDPCTIEHKLRDCITTKDPSCSRTFPNTLTIEKDRVTWVTKIPRYKYQEHYFSFMLLDVDLSSHVTAIVEEMTLPEVRTFVRNHKVPEPVIDETVRDYFNDTSEQKIKLFQVWYQRHGIRGAYGTLISSLREFKMCAAADKIEEKLKAAVSTCQEGGQSYSDDTEQSKTCTQESRNSYNDSTELSKTYSGSLEET